MAKRTAKTTTKKKATGAATAKAKPQTRTRSKANGASANPHMIVLPHAQIADRAYHLWRQTGNPDELHNWREAERQLTQEQGRA